MGEGNVLRVRLIQKEGNKLFDPAYLFDEGSTVSWIPCGRKLTCSFPGIKFFYGPDTYYGEEVSVLGGRAVRQAGGAHLRGEPPQQHLQQVLRRDHPADAQALHLPRVHQRHGALPDPRRPEDPRGVRAHHRDGDGARLRRGLSARRWPRRTTPLPPPPPLTYEAAGSTDILSRTAARPPRLRSPGSSINN